MRRLVRSRVRIRGAVRSMIGATLAWSVAGCEPPPPARPPLAMEHIGTVPDVPRTVSEDDGNSEVTTPNSGTPKPAREASCKGGDFEALDDVLRQCEVPMPSPSDLPKGIGKKLDVRVGPANPSVPRGGKIDLKVTLKNLSDEPLTLYFSGDPTPRFDVEAMDTKGRRVDLPAGKPPPWPKGTGPQKSGTLKGARVTLDPGASGSVAISWRAVKNRWAPELASSWEGKGYPRTPGAPLARGKYTLRFALPLLGAFESGELELPKITINVT